MHSSPVYVHVAGTNVGQKRENGRMEAQIIHSRGKEKPSRWLDFLERVTSLRRLVPLALLWLHCRPAGNARQSTGLSDSIVRASFTRKRKAQPFGWTFWGAGDEASPPRAAGTPMVALPSSRQCPTVHRTVGFNYSSLVTRKRKAQPFGWTFLERVTRLELATSTLARWRSTG